MIWDIKAFGVQNNLSSGHLQLTSFFSLAFRQMQHYFHIWVGRHSLSHLFLCWSMERSQGQLLICLGTFKNSVGVSKCAFNSMLFNFWKIFGPFLRSLLNLLQHWLCSVVWSLGHKACGILAPQPGTENALPAVAGEIQATGPPGRSLGCFVDHTLP